MAQNHLAIENAESGIDSGRQELKDALAQLILVLTSAAERTNGMVVRGPPAYRAG